MRAHPVPGAGRSAARRARPRDARAGPRRADRPAADPVERRDLRDPQHADLRRRLRSHERVARAGQPLRARPATSASSGTSASLDLAERGAAARRRDDGADDPARLRGVAGARRGVAPVQLAVNAEKGSAAGIVQAYASHDPRRVRGGARRRAARRRAVGVPDAAPRRGARASMSARAAGTTRRSTTSTTWCRASSSRW